VEVYPGVKNARRSTKKAPRPIVAAIAAGWVAALLFHGCAGSHDAAVVERAVDDAFPSADLAADLSAIDGARVARTGNGIRVTLSSDTLFGTDSAMLLIESERTVEEIAGVIARYPAARIVVTAHADSVGRGDYRMKMTERQALSIGELLVDMGVPPSRIETRGFGDVEPVAPNATPEGRGANRRVTIAILPEPAAEKP
jgi:outer membrane protein OmpA-like peptidoglycan-associated protein